MSGTLQLTLKIFWMQEEAFQQQPKKRKLDVLEIEELVDTYYDELLAFSEDVSNDPMALYAESTGFMNDFSFH